MKKLILVVFGLYFSSMSYAQTYEKWTLDTSVEGVHIASTTNAVNASVGIFCMAAKGSCLAFLTPNFGCKDDAKTPLTLSTPAGSLPVIGTCAMLGSKKILLLDNYSSILTAFTGSGEIGFTMPMHGGQFTELRFSTAGAAQALHAAFTHPGDT